MIKFINFVFGSLVGALVASIMVGIYYLLVSFLDLNGFLIMMAVGLIIYFGIAATHDPLIFKDKE